VGARVDWRGPIVLLALAGLAGATACGDDGSGPDQGSSEGSGSSGPAPTTSPTTTDSSSGAVDSGSSGSSGTGDTEGEPLSAEPGESFYAFVGERVVLDGSASTGAVAYRWNLDDGSPAPEPGADPTAAVAYATPGRYRPVLTVYDAVGNALSASLTVTVTHVPTHAPRHASTVVRLSDDVRVAVVSPDSDELTIVGRNDEGEFTVQQRLPTCLGPRTAAALADGRVAVACQGDDAVQVLDPEGGAPTVTVALPRGARPYGVVAVDDQIYATLQARGELVHIDAAGAPTLVQSWPALPDARGVAVLPDGRLVVTRWRSPDTNAELVVLDPETGGDIEFVTLAFDLTEPSDTASGGVPSYLDQVLVSPIGDVAALPTLQANSGQGEYLDGNPLTFETTVRGVVSYLELPVGGAPLEDLARRRHFDNHGFLAAGAHSSRGDYLFLVARGSRAVERVDTFNGGQAGVLLDVGYAPAGVVLSADDRFLFVDAYLSRTLVVYDVTDYSMLPQPVAELPIPTAEPLSAERLRGKQLFNDSFDPRLAKDSYIACAHCHLDGESDHRTWDFTDRGEGLRNTITLLGRGGSDHGPIHWSANFDEVQDFENDIRHAFEGQGLLADADWNAGTTQETLGDPKVGLSADLDALAVYVSSLVEFPRSPFRQPDGGLDAMAQAGEALFLSPALGCATCHAGPRLTDSVFVEPGVPLLHDVGTLTEASGQRLGGPLLGLDTPTLREVWNNAPYLHDGSAATLLEVLTVANPADQHGVTSTLTPIELEQLVAYLQSLE
jgi:PKD domain